MPGETVPNATPRAATAEPMRTLLPRSVDEIAALVRDDGRGIRIAGAGTWLDAGHPVRASLQLSTAALSGVREYVPQDLTISVGAGTTLAELNTLTAAHNQWCPLLPWGDDQATVAAVIATATAGPFAAALGRPRDLVLGLECVDGQGRIIRAGGRVVKNVAGFDLTRLMTGAWGTLGVITELHLRLRARPAVDESFTLSGAPADAVREFLRGPLAPMGALQIPGSEGTRTPASERNDESTWLLRLGGNAAFVNASRSALTALGSLTPEDPDVWIRVRREHAPPERATKWPWTPLAREIKRRFDPRGVLNPGLLGETA